MALPKLNEMPKYQATIPSTQNEITFRPFVVKEEKILLIAMESQDPKQIAGSILDTVISCVYDNVDPKSLTSYDVEYLFIKIRSKSIGENTNVNLICKHCQHENETAINLEDIKINGDPLPKNIELSDKVTIEMKQPTYLDIASNEKVTGDSAMDRIFGLIYESIAAVITADERIDMSEVNFKEFEEFVESMSSEQFGKIREFMENIPTLRHKVSFKCESCGKDNEITLEGMQSFF